MPKQTVAGYKLRRQKNGGADRYGQFQGGKQQTPDIIAGKSMYSIKVVKSEW